MDDLSKLQEENYNLQLRLFAAEQQLRQHADKAAGALVEADQDLLVRSRDALARMEADLTASRADLTLALSELSAHAVEVESLRSALASEKAAAQATQAALQTRVEALTADATEKRSALDAARFRLASLEQEVESLRANVRTFALEHTSLSAQVQEREGQVEGLERELGRTRAHLQDALDAAASASTRASHAERDMVTVGVEAEGAVAAVERELGLTRAALADSQAEGAAQGRKLREYAGTISSLEAALESERERARAVEAGLRGTMGAFLALVVHKLSSAASAAGEGPQSEAMLAALSSLPTSSSDLSSPGTLERAMSTLEALPSLAAWFAAAAGSLQEQVERRIQACLATVDSLAGRLDGVDGGVVELREGVTVRVAAQSEVVQGMDRELGQAREEVHRWREATARAERERDAALARATAGESAAAYSMAECDKYRAAAEGSASLAAEAAEAVAELEGRLQDTVQQYEDRLLQLGREGERALTALEAALSDKSSECEGMRDKLVTVLRRLEAARSVDIPAAVRAALGAEVERAAAVVRDASSAARAAKAASDRLLTFAHRGGLAPGPGGSEPAWLASARQAVLQQAGALAAAADAASALAARLHHFSSATVLAASEGAVQASRQDAGQAQASGQAQGGRAGPTSPTLAAPARSGKGAARGGSGAGGYSRTRELGLSSASVTHELSSTTTPSAPSPPQYSEAGRKGRAGPVSGRVLVSGMASYVASTSSTSAGTGAGTAGSMGSPLQVEHLSRPVSPSSPSRAASTTSSPARGVEEGVQTQGQGQGQAEGAAATAQLAAEVQQLKMALASMQASSTAAVPFAYAYPPWGVPPLPSLSAPLGSTGGSGGMGALLVHPPPHTLPQAALLMPPTTTWAPTAAPGTQPQAHTASGATVAAPGLSSGWEEQGQGEGHSRGKGGTTGGTGAQDDWGAAQAARRAQHEQMTARLASLGLIQ